VRTAEEALRLADEESYWRHLQRRSRGHGVPEETSSLSSGLNEVATALFLNLRRFAPFCQGMDPGEVATTLNQLLADLEAVLVRHRGLVTTHLGGGFMALFRADDHAERAVQAAVELLAVVAEFNCPRELLGLRLLPAEIGVASGPMFVGNIGTYRRMSFTALGTAVNLAGRLMRSCVEGLPCISVETYERVRDHFECRGPREVELRNLGRREVWDVVGRKKESSGFA
jgi:adenylate cyclase